MRTYRKNFGFGFTRSGFTLLVILAIVGIAMPAMACDAGWYDRGWGHRKAITIDRTKVVSDQKDFPVMINLGSDPDLAARAQSTGNDLVFTLADGTTKLPCKVESFTSNNGALVAWVKVPVLSSGANTVLYMYYGNHMAPNQQDTSSSTWTDQYKGNWRKRDIISWVQTEFNNHNSPSTFYSRGTDETEPQVVTPTQTPTPTPTITPTPAPTPATDTAPTQTQLWNDCGWSYRRAITIDRTKVLADQTDFPVLINIASDPSLAAHAQSSGNDIIFTLSDERTKIPHKIESYTSTTGALVAWVKVPSLSASANTVLYMYYGNPTAPAQQDTTTSWSYRYKGTWSSKAISSWIKTKYNNQMYPLTFLTVGSEVYQPQSCAPIPVPTPVPTLTPAPVLTPASANPQPTLIPVDPTPEPTPVDPTPVQTTVEPTAVPTTVEPTTVPTTVEPTTVPTTVDPTPVPTTVEPTPVPTPVFACTGDSYSLVTPDGETAGCVAITNEWTYDETTKALLDTLSIAYTMADSFCLKSADVGVAFDSAEVQPQSSPVFDASSCTKSYTFSIPLPQNADDVAYLYVTAHGVVQKVASETTSADIDVVVPGNPIYYIIQG
jgi:hypothetical protein